MHSAAKLILICPYDVERLISHSPLHCIRLTIYPIIWTNIGTIAVYTLIKYIEDHVFSIPDIKTLATQMHFSYNHISHLFKKRTGTTLKHYVIQVKMKKAQQLITEGAWPISEIAVMLGYESIQSFSKAFKKEVGMSPSAFKKMRITPVEPESVIASQSRPE